MNIEGLLSWIGAHIALVIFILFLYLVNQIFNKGKEDS